MRVVTVKGKRYLASHLAAGEVEPGLLVSGIAHRRAMRVVCLDDGDAILRNLRHPDLLEAESLERMPLFYERIVPEAEDAEGGALPDGGGAGGGGLPEPGSGQDGAAA